jgi:metallo-beta-lactamase class B
MVLRLVSAVVCAAVLTPAQQSPVRQDNLPFPPYKVIGNVYYVGTNDTTSYLITTPAGHILVNSGYEETVPIIRNSVHKLGFKLTDIKLLLNSDAHIDHVAGQAALQKLTGAKVAAMEEDVPVIEGGGKGDFRWDGIYGYPPSLVDHKLSDNEEIHLGGTTLVAHLTAGHSRGCTTWTLDVEDGGKTYSVVIVGGTSLNPGVKLLNNPKYPTVAADYERTFRVLRALRCDVFLGAHAGYYGMQDKYERMKAGSAMNPFIDPAGYTRYINVSEKGFREQLAHEMAAAHEQGITRRGSLTDRPH